MRLDPTLTYFVNAPFSCAAQILTKLENEMTMALVILPLWPSQIWFTKFLHLVVSPILLLPKPAPVNLPWEPARKHPLKHLQLFTAICSRNNCRRSILCHKLSIYSSLGTLKVHTPTMLSDLKSGSSTVVNETLIPINQLFLN